MTKVLYLVEVAVAAGLGWLAVRGWLWVYRSADTWPGSLWLCLPLAALALGFLLRWRREVPLVAGVRGWHEAIRRRMAERQP